MRNKINRKEDPAIIRQEPEKDERVKFNSLSFAANV